MSVSVRDREREGRRKKRRGLSTYAAHSNPRQQQYFPSRHTPAASRTLHRTHFRQNQNQNQFYFRVDVETLKQLWATIANQIKSNQTLDLTIRVGAALLETRPLWLCRGTPLFRPIRERLHPSFCRPRLQSTLNLGCFRLCRPALGVCCLGFCVLGSGLCISAASASVVLRLVTKV